MGLLPEASKPLSPKKENNTLSFLSPPVKPGAEYSTLEEYGGNSFYRPFWGTLTYKQLNPSQSQVTYQGKEGVFDQDFIGKWLEPSRIHKCSSEYPSSGRNYFPGALAVVYSRVIEVLDGHNLIVDYGYNGGSLSNPVPISDQDGIFFFDNKFSIEVWSRAASNKQILKALSGRVSSIPVGYLGAAIWKAGDRLQLAYPETGLRQEIEVLVSFSGNAGNLLIKPVHLEVEFPEKSIVTALYFLNSEACFDNVNYVNEDLSACYSERIDYRPQGLRLRQLLTEDESKRVKIIGGRLSWYSNLDNRFEPEIELTEKPHMVNTKSVVNILLNPVIADGKGAFFGYQYKKGKEEEIFILTRIIAKNGRSIDLSNSILGSDVYLEGDGKFILDNMTLRNPARCQIKLPSRRRSCHHEWL